MLSSFRRSSRIETEEDTSESSAPKQLSPRDTLLVLLGLLAVLYVAISFSLHRNTSAAWMELRPTTEFDNAKMQSAMRWRLPAEENLSAEEAGEVLHRLYFGGLESKYFTETHMQTPETDQVEQVPMDSSAAPAATLSMEAITSVPEADSLFAEMGMPIEKWDSITKGARNFAYDGSGRDLFAMLARADSVDVLGTRYTLPFPSTLRAEELERPQVGGLRDIGYLKVGLAAEAIAEGELERAEEIGRELVSVGGLIYQDAQFLTESLLGAILTGYGMRVLEYTYQAAGDEDSLAEIRESLSVPSEPLPALEMGKIAEYVDRTDVPQSLKWEHVQLEALLRSCRSLPVFSTGEAPLEPARRALVKDEASRALFDLYTRNTPQIRSILDWPKMVSHCFGGA